jgi:hypothetical protein
VRLFSGTKGKFSVRKAQFILAARNFKLPGKSFHTARPLGCIMRPANFLMVFDSRWLVEQEVELNTPVRTSSGVVVGFVGMICRGYGRRTLTPLMVRSRESLIRVI